MRKALLLLGTPRARRLGPGGAPIAIDQGRGKVALYRLPWLTIDETRTA